MNPIVKLVSTLNERWSRDTQEEQAFLSAATSALEEFPLLDYDSILLAISSIWSHAERLSCETKWDGFGEPRIVVRCGDRFDLNFLFWWNNITTIHDHYTSVVSKRLLGHALETQFGFESSGSTSIDNIGSLIAESMVFDSPGDVKQVVSGRSTIHQVIPISQPTITLLIIKRSDVQLQYDYIGQLVFPSLRNADSQTQFASAIAGLVEVSKTGRTISRFEQYLQHIPVDALCSAMLQLTTFYNFDVTNKGLLIYLKTRDADLAKHFGRALEIDKTTRTFLASRRHVSCSETRLLMAIAYFVSIPEFNLRGRADLFCDSRISEWLGLIVREN